MYVPGSDQNGDDLSMNSTGAGSSRSGIKDPERSIGLGSLDNDNKSSEELPFPPPPLVPLGCEIFGFFLPSFPQNKRKIF